jgi:hypothetical protein
VLENSQQCQGQWHHPVSQLVACQTTTAKEMPLFKYDVLDGQTGVSDPLGRAALRLRTPIMLSTLCGEKLRDRS